MNYLQKKKMAMMNSVASGGRLPSEYQEVEWIGNDSSAWLNINEHFERYDEVETELQIDFTTYDSYLISHRPWNTPNNSRFFMGGVNPNGNLGIGFGTEGGNNANLRPGTALTNDWLVWTYDNEYFEIASLNIGCNVSNWTSNFSATQTISIFRDWWTIRKGKIKYYKQKRNGQTIVDLIPCYRKSDNVIGMYDVATSTFYTNQGSGTFTKGNDVN